MSSRQKLFVTGSTGFIGSHFIRAKRVNDSFDVYWMSSSHWGKIHDDERVTYGSLEGPDNVSNIFNNIAPDHVVHLATKFIAHHEPNDIRTLVASNLEFSILVADAAANIGASFLVTSSAWQRYEGRRESVSLYASMKEAFSTILDYYSVSLDLTVREVFLFDTYGPKDSRNKLISQLLKAAMLDGKITLGNPDKLINLSYIDDVVDQLCWALANSPRRDWVIRAPHPVSLQFLVRIVEQVTDRALEVTWEKGFDRPREMIVDWRFGTLIPTHPQFSLESGIRSIWEEELHLRQ